MFNIFYLFLCLNYIMSRFPQYNVNNEHQLIRRQNTYVLEQKMVTIHTEDRDISQWSNANNFEVRLPETITNVVGLKLLEIELPGNQYTFSNNQQNTKLQFYLIPNVSTDTIKYLALESQHTIPYEITIQEGFFTPSEMATSLENLMNNVVTDFLVNVALIPGATYDNFKVYYDKVGQKLYFGNTYDNFQFKFTEQIHYSVPCSSIINDNQPTNVWNNYANWGLPAYLGFGKQIYDPIDTSNNYVFEYVSYDWLIPETSVLPPTIDPHAYYLAAPFTVSMFGDSAIYMEVDKYNTIDELKPYSRATTQTYNNDFNGIVNAAFAKIPLTAVPNSQIFNSKYNYLLNNNNYDPPIDKIRKLKIKFRYHDGRLVEFKDNNFNFSIMFYYYKNEIARDFELRIPEHFKF